MRGKLPRADDPRGAHMGRRAAIGLLFAGAWIVAGGGIVEAGAEGGKWKLKDGIYVFEKTPEEPSVATSNSYKKSAEQARIKAEAEAKAEEEERKKAQEETRTKAEAEAKAKAEEEERKKAQEETRTKAEAEAKASSAKAEEERKNKVAREAAAAAQEKTQSPEFLQNLAAEADKKTTTQELSTESQQEQAEASTLQLRERELAQKGQLNALLAVGGAGGVTALALGDNRKDGNNKKTQAPPPAKLQLPKAKLNALEINKKQWGITGKSD